MNGLLTKLEVKILEFYCLFMDGDEFPCSRALETFQFRFRCVLFSMAETEVKIGIFLMISVQYSRKG